MVNNIEQNLDKATADFHQDTDTKDTHLTNLPATHLNHFQEAMQEGTHPIDINYI
jgi:hypothetical protein